MSIKLMVSVTAVILAGFAAQASTSASSTLSKDFSPKTRTVGVDLQPLFLALGGLGAKVDYFATDKFSVGLSGVSIRNRQMNTSDKDASATTTTYKLSYSELNLNTRFMMTGTNFSDGAYLSPSIGYVTTRISDYSIYSLDGGFATPVATLLAGYQFVNAQSGFRVTAGAGYRLVQENTIVVKDSSGKEILRDKSSNLNGLALDLGVGMMF